MLLPPNTKESNHMHIAPISHSIIFDRSPNIQSQLGFGGIISEDKNSEESKISLSNLRDAPNLHQRLSKRRESAYPQNGKTLIQRTRRNSSTMQKRDERSIFRFIRSIIRRAQDQFGMSQGRAGSSNLKKFSNPGILEGFEKFFNNSKKSKKPKKSKKAKKPKKSKSKRKSRFPGSPCSPYSPTNSSFSPTSTSFCPPFLSPVTFLQPQKFPKLPKKTPKLPKKTFIPLELSEAASQLLSKHKAKPKSKPKKSSNPKRKSQFNPKSRSRNFRKKRAKSNSVGPLSLSMFSN